MNSHFCKVGTVRPNLDKIFKPSLIEKSSIIEENMSAKIEVSK